MLPLLSAILSFGAIYALIPVIIIVILILAAAGMQRGTGIFQLFGIATLAGIGSQIGRGGAGKGLGRKKYSPKYYGKGTATGLA